MRSRKIDRSQEGARAGEEEKGGGGLNKTTCAVQLKMRSPIAPPMGLGKLFVWPSCMDA